jgi:hypothetical protein
VNITYIYSLSVISYFSAALICVYICASMAFRVKTKSWYFIKRYLALLIILLAYGWYLINPHGLSKSPFLIAYHALLFSFCHIPVCFILIDHKILFWLIHDKKKAQPNIYHIRIKDMIFMLSLGIGVFLLCWFVFNYEVNLYNSIGQ